jgi:hypothetical protein
MYLTRDRKIYASDSYRRTNKGGAYMPKHLMKLIELFDVSSESLLHLEHLEVALEIQGMDPEEPRFQMVYKRVIEILAVTSSDSLHWPNSIPHNVYGVRDPSSSSISL